MKNNTETDYLKITKESKTNFLYSFSLLPAEKNEAINTIYAFCRKTDDIVDDESTTIEDRFHKLCLWREEFEKALNGNTEHALLEQVVKIINKFAIPVKPFYDLIEGMEMDLKKSRYKTFEELYDYCYRVAATVGLMSIEIFGYRNESTKEFAVNLGLAMQLTNILRDVKKDTERGRIYIPEEDLIRFGYDENELLDNKCNNLFIELMKFESNRAKKYYKKADDLLSKEDKGLMFPARIMEHIYFNILKKIESMNFNVYNKVAKVSRIRKLLITFGVYSKYRLLYDFKDPRLVINKR
ncbi:phytoene/squalene synthase family protein [Bacteroidota bacterium]